MSHRPRPIDTPNARELTRRLIRASNEEPGNLEATLHRIAETARQDFSADFCIIFASNPITGSFVGSPIVVGDGAREMELALSRPREDGMAQTVLQEGIIVVENLEKEPGYASDFTRAHGIRSFAGLALRTMRRQRPLAVLYLDSRTPSGFMAEDKDVLEDFTHHASRHLQNTWFLARNQAVAEVGREINQCRLASHGDLFGTLIRQLSRIIDANHLALLAVRRREAEAVDLYVRQNGKTEQRESLNLEEGWGWLFEQRKGVLVRSWSVECSSYPFDLTALPGIAPAGGKPESLLFVRLLFEDRTLGILGVQHPSLQAYEHEDRHILELLANHVALALNNFHLFEDLRRLNEAGQTLTRNLESEDVLQRVVDLIHETTGADLTLLYPYLQATESFVLPPPRKGSFWAPDSSFHLQFVRADDIAALAIKKGVARFAREAETLYSLLGGPGQRKGSFEKREEVRSVAVVPLRVGEESVGVLFVNFRTSQSFDEPQQQLISSLANYAAIAIKNAREFGALSRRHIEELKTLQAVDRELSQFDNLADLLQKILEQAVSRVKAATIASVLLYHPRRQELRVETAIGRGRERWLGRTLRLNERGITVQAFEQKRLIMVPDVHALEWREIFLDIDAGTRSELDVPLLDGERVLGVLNFESTEPNAFTEQDIRFLSTLAGQAVLAVRQAQALETQKRLAEERETLIRLGKELTRRLENQVLKLIVERALENTHADAGGLALLDTDRKNLFVAAEVGNSNEKPGRLIPLDKGVIGFMMTQGLPKLNIGDVTRDSLKDIYLPVIPDTRSELAVSLFAGRELKGVLNIESREPDHFDERDERFIEALADFAVIAIQNAERYNRAEERREKLKALLEGGQQVIRQLDNPAMVMRAVVEHAVKLTGATQAHFDLYEGGRLVTTYQARSSQGLDVDSFKVFDLTEPGAEMPPLGIMGYVAETRTSYRTRGDAQQDHFFKGDKWVHSELTVPLLRGSGELLGVLNVESRWPDAFDPDTQEALELYAAQTVVAIENTRNFARAERERRRFELLLKASQELEKISDPEKAYKVVLEIAAAQYQSQVVLRRFDPDTKDLIRVLATQKEPPPKERIPYDDPLNGRVAREKQPLVVPDAEDPPPGVGTFDRSNPRDRAFIVVPVQFAQCYYGNLALSHERPHYFQNADLELLSGLAQQLAFTLHRIEEARTRQEREQRAKEGEVMSRVGHQAYEITHRMGNEFGPHQTYVRRLREALHKAGVHDANLEGYLDEIANSAEWVLDVSDRLHEEVAHPTQPSLVSVSELIDDAIPGLHLDHRPDIALMRQVSPGTGKVFVDQKQITAALFNLMSNAVEAMPGGGGLTVGAENDGDRRVRIWVRDTGPGVPEKDRAKVFALFYSSKGKSRGFGLWSVQTNVSVNGGTVTIGESQPGEGATFVVELPRAVEDPYV